MLINRHSLPAVLRALIAFLALCISVALQWLPLPPGTHFGDEWLRDGFIVLRASSVPETRFALVDIDEASLAEIGPWPWSRERLAEMLESLIAQHGASSVALDLVLPERADVVGDTRLAMLAQFGPLVVAQAFDYNGNRPLRIGQVVGGRPVMPPSTDTSATTSAAGAPTSTSTASATPTTQPSMLPGSGVVVASGFIANHAGLALAAHSGNIGFLPDKDGMIRRLPWQTRFDGRDYPTLALALLGCCSAGKPQPVAASAHWRVPYTRQWAAYTVIPAADILHNRIAPGLLHNKPVLLGSSALGLSDRVATPLSPNTSGMLVHAAALSSLLDQQDGVAPAPWPGRALACAYSLLVAILVWVSFPRLSALTNVSLLALAGLVWLGMAYVISGHDGQFSSTGPLVANLFLLAVAVPFDWQMSQGKSRRLLGTLRQYVAQTVVDELLRRDLRDPLAPVHCEVTTLIADMQGYTSQVASLSLEQAAQLTRDFLACLTAPVIARGGTLDKYTGDGLVAFWGAPLPVPDHADLALEAAAEMLQAVARFSAAREAQGLPRLRVRIGIESGHAMAGDFGSNFRSIYTAVGDSVNVASRLETLARDLPHDVVIGEGTARACHRHKLQLIGETVLRGKEQATVLYTLPA
jgi:adenylate cyclase